MSINIALVGYGSIAREHARAILQLQRAHPDWELRLRGVMGRDRGETERFALEFGMPLATTYLHTLLADPEVNAVVITSPTDLHSSQAEQALRAGKDVLCEIPIATSLLETDRVIKVADETGRRLMVCHTQRFYLGLAEARRMIASGELHPYAVVARQIRLRRENVNWKGRRRTWTDNLLWHHACHSVDTALWLLGATGVDVTAQVAPPSGNLQIPMDLTIAMRTPSGQIATIVMSYNSHFALHDYLVIGEETSVLWEEDLLRTPDRQLAGQAGDALETAVPRQDAEFFAALAGGGIPPVSGRDVRPTMVVLQAVQDLLDAQTRSAAA